jgi:excisionase family DNA binding protein
MITTHEPIHLSAHEAAAQLGVVTTTITRMCQSGHFKGAILTDGRWFIPAASVQPAQHAPVSYSYKQLHALWGVSIRTLQRRVRDGKLKAWKCGRTVRIPESTVLAFEAEQTLS